MPSEPTAEPSHPAATIMLEGIAAEIEAFVGASGWSDPPTLFALVPTRLLAGDPAAAVLLGGAASQPDEISPDAITPIAQDEMPAGPLDQALAQIGWPDEVVGCSLSQQIVMLPPSAEAALDGLDSAAVGDPAAGVAQHPDRREARLVVAVLRDGRVASVLRLRSVDGAAEDLLTGPDLAPNLAQALLATFDAD